MKKWNWQLNGWPKFKFDIQCIKKAEASLNFALSTGILIGKLEQLKQNDKEDLVLDLVGTEALKTSEIEGEYLDRESLQSSLRKHFGLTKNQVNLPKKESGIAEVMVDLYKNFDRSLSHKILFNWHCLIRKDQKQLSSIGKYRSHKEPMQIISGTIGNSKVHFEAPPSTFIKKEMNQFISWFNDTNSTGTNPESPLIRSAISHLYFESIHPFEDGNGRIGRALIEKALSQSFKQPTLIAISYTIEKQKKDYYHALASASTTLDVTEWILYFADLLKHAQTRTTFLLDFVIYKYQFFEKYRDSLNSRQEKALLRMFRAGPEGFKGGMSADKYISITKTSRATATRDLQNLSEKGALIATGELRHRRYFLKNP